MLDLKAAQEINGITIEAGRLLAKLAQDPNYMKPLKKGDGSPVTKADIEVSAFLVDKLQSFGFLVVSEESLPQKPPQSKDSYFLVDPLDGTKYFARGEKEFAVCVGFVHEGFPIYGAIQNPTEDELTWAYKGHGAYLNDQPIDHQGPSANGLKAYSSGFHRRADRKWVLEALNIVDVREKGSALKFCDIAKGDIDLYMRFGPTSEWDTAAAQIILEESHCCIYEAKTGKRLTYAKKNYLNHGVIVCHESLSDKVLKLLQEHFGGIYER